MMSPATATSLWLFFRALRWLAWIVFFGWSIYYGMNRTPHLNSFGQLRLYASMMWFISGNFALFMGCMELMMRDRAGLARARFGQLIPPPRSPDAAANTR